MPGLEGDSRSLGFDLKAFLQQQESAGQIDSEGSFTITREKRKQKLAQFALVEEYDWVLKLVQAANRWNCEKLVISQTRVATSFLFVPGPQSRLPTDVEIIDGLEGNIDNKDTVALSLALRSLVEQVDLSFVLAVRRGGELGQPIFAGEDIGKLSPGTRHRWSATGNDGMRLTVSHFRSGESVTGRFLPTLSRMESRDLQISNALKDACFASPVPIYLDGFCITEFANDPILGKTRYYRPLVQAARKDKRSEYEDHVYSARADSFELALKTSLSSADRFYIRVGEWWELARFLRQDVEGFKVPRKPNEKITRMEPHRLFWVREGVVVTTERIPNRSTFSTVYVIVCADDLRTDLGGLQVQLDDKTFRAGATVLDSIAAAIQTRKRAWRNEALDLDWSPVQGELDYADLEAGYSLLTTSLGFFDHISDFVKSCRKKAKHVLIDFKVRTENLNPWSQTIENDLETISRDFRAFASKLRKR